MYGTHFSNMIKIKLVSEFLSYGGNSFERAISAQAADQLWLESAEFDSIENYLRYVAVKQVAQYPNLLKRLDTAAHIIEPLDSKIIENDNKRSTTFFGGAAIGSYVAMKFFPPNIDGILLDTRIALLLNKPNQNIEARERMAAYLANISMDGFDYASPFHGLIEEWEPKVTSDVRSQHFFGMGFGLMVKMMEQAQELYTTDGIDWDNTINRLLDDGGFGYNRF